MTIETSSIAQNDRKMSLCVCAEVEEVWLAAAAGAQGCSGHQADLPLQAGQPIQPPAFQECLAGG